MNTTTHKAGWRTTEFWVTVCTSIGVVASAAGGVIPGKYAALALAVSTAAYSIGRSLVKSSLSDSGATT